MNLLEQLEQGAETIQITPEQFNKTDLNQMLELNNRKYTRIDRGLKFLHPLNTSAKKANMLMPVVKNKKYEMFKILKRFLKKDSFTVIKHNNTITFTIEKNSLFKKIEFEI